MELSRALKARTRSLGVMWHAIENERKDTKGVVAIAVIQL